MKSSSVIFCLAVIYCSSAVLILQSTPSTVIVSPAGEATLYSSYYNTLEPNLGGAGVEWITGSKKASPLHFQSLFYASCIGPANLTITAANNFTAYLDGVLIGNGTNHSAVYTFPIKISCGSHNFTVIVYTTEDTNLGLTFAINQDQSNCYNCQSTGYWNENSCSCSCINNQVASNCKCTAPKVWKDYPICGCGCPSLILKPLPAQASQKAVENHQFRFYCLAPRYYSEETCSCVCHNKYCPPRYYFDAQTCSCFPYLT